jgi:hypothetical protein
VFPPTLIFQRSVINADVQQSLLKLLMSTCDMKLASMVEC